MMLRLVPSMTESVRTDDPRQGVDRAHLSTELRLRTHSFSC